MYTVKYGYNILKRIAACTHACIIIIINNPAADCKLFTIRYCFNSHDITSYTYSVKVVIIYLGGNVLSGREGRGARCKWDLMLNLILW